jgi:hypothetical protein
MRIINETWAWAHIIDVYDLDYAVVSDRLLHTELGQFPLVAS